MLRESTRLCSAGCWLLEDDQKGLGHLSPAPRVTDSIDWGFNGSLGTQTHTKPGPVALLLDRSSLLQCKKCLFFSLNHLQSAPGLLCSSKFFDLCCLRLVFFLSLSLRYQMELSDPKISPCAASDSGNFTTCESAGACEPQLLLAANTGAVSASVRTSPKGWFSCIPGFPFPRSGVKPQFPCIHSECISQQQRHRLHRTQFVLQPQPSHFQLLPDQYFLFPTHFMTCCYPLPRESAFLVQNLSPVAS